MRGLACLISILVMLVAGAVQADPTPGTACTAMGAVMQTGGAESARAGNLMVCESGEWRAILSFNGTGQVTVIGNQTCDSGTVLKYDGTKWACAQDETGGGGGGLPDCPVGHILVKGADDWECSGAAPSLTDCNGATSFTTAGAHNYHVPMEFSSITVRLWGGGGGGGGGGNGSTKGGFGGQSSIISLGLFANGGAGGSNSTSNCSSGGAGGTATGGTTNTTGGAGSSTSGGAGGDAPNGGVGGEGGGAGMFASGQHGGAPGAGGGGVGGSASVDRGCGGGAGGYTSRTYTPAELVPGTNITDIIVGNKGTNGSGLSSGGQGALGQVQIICTP